MDASNKIKSAQMLCDLMKEVVQKVGEQVIQIDTNSANNDLANDR